MNPPYNWCERVGLAADGAEITVKNDQMVSEVSSGDRTAAVSTPPPPPVYCIVHRGARTRVRANTENTRAGSLRVLGQGAIIWY